jgi:hypothetical protein
MLSRGRFCYTPWIGRFGRAEWLGCSRYSSLELSVQADHDLKIWSFRFAKENPGLFEHLGSSIFVSIFPCKDVLCIISQNFGFHCCRRKCTTRVDTPEIESQTLYASPRFAWMVMMRTRRWSMILKITGMCRKQCAGHLTESNWFQEH